jgi:hypothetical protein
MSIYFCKTKVVIVTCHDPPIELLYDKENRNSGEGDGKLKEGDLLEDPGVDGRIILNGSSRHGMVGGGLGQRQVAGAFECSNELSGSLKCWEFLG